MQNKDRIINDFCYDTAHPKQQIFLSWTFPCRLCKHLKSCHSAQNCSFVNYIRERLLNTTYEYGLEKPLLKVYAKNDSYTFMNIVRIISRSERMRLSKQK